MKKCCMFVELARKETGKACGDDPCTWSLEVVENQTDQTNKMNIHKIVNHRKKTQHVDIEIEVENGQCSLTCRTVQKKSIFFIQVKLHHEMCQEMNLHRCWMFVVEATCDIQYG